MFLSRSDQMLLCALSQHNAGEEKREPSREIGCRGSGRFPAKSKIYVITSIAFLAPCVCSPVFLSCHYNSAMAEMTAPKQTSRLT